MGDHGTDQLMRTYRYRQHGCEEPGVTGSAEHVGDPLTVEQIKALRRGTRIVVTWSGGNGPHEGVVVEDKRLGPCWARPDDDVILHPLLKWTGQLVPLNRVTLAPPPDEDPDATSEG